MASSISSSSSGTVSFAGLGSGLDTQSIIDKLVAVEKQPANLLSSRKNDTTKQISLVGDFISKLQAIKTQAQSLDTASDLQVMKASSSDETRIKVSADSTASLGNFAIKVDQLAQAETSRSRTFASHDQVGVAGTGALDITVGTGSPFTVNYDNNDTLDSIAQKINDSGAAVTASVLFDGTDYRLNVTSKSTGAASAIGFGGSGDLLGFDAANAQVVDAQDAQIQLNGTTVHRASNTMTDVVQGVTFNLLAQTPAGGSATQVAVASDPDGLRKKMQGLVDAYNALSTAVTTQLTYTGDGKTQKGTDTLFGDPTITGLQMQMSSVIGGLYANGTSDTSLGQLGISLGRDGKLTLDASKFDAATAKDPSALTNLFAGPNHNGLAAAITSMVDQYANATDGLLLQKQKSLTALNTSYDKQIQQIDDTADALGTRLQKQFTAMEQTISLLNSQTSYIDKIFSAKLGE